MRGWRLVLLLAGVALIAAACRTALKEGFAQPGDQVAIAAGMPFAESGTTNLLRIAEVWAQPA